MVDEMLIMRANPLRFEIVHVLSTLKEFEEDTMWIHVLSTRSARLSKVSVLVFRHELQLAEVFCLV